MIRKLQLKKEIYWARKLMSPRFSFGDRIVYLKNRFQDRALLSKTSSFIKKPNADFETHILCQKTDVWMLVWALKSFLLHSPVVPQIIIHDDGTLDEYSKFHLHRIFGDLRIIPRAEADSFILAKIPVSSRLYQYRSKGHVVILNILDTILYGGSDKLMFANSDVLFFSTPQEICDFVTGANKLDALASRQPKPYLPAISPQYTSQYNLIERDAFSINTGVILMNRNVVTLDHIIEVFEQNLLPIKDYYAEAIAWCGLLGRFNFGYLPEDTYHTKGVVHPATIFKHYTSGRRHELYAWGIKQVEDQFKSA